MSEAEKLFGVIEIEIDSCYNGKSYKVTIDPEDDVRGIKRVLESLWDIPSSNSILHFGGRELDNYSTIKEVGIKDGSRLQLYLRMMGGPINIRRVHTEDYRNLKNTVEKVRRELSKKYPQGVRVLAILHKNSNGHFKVMKIFDAIQDGRTACQNGPDRPKSPATNPKPSSPCKLIKYRKSYDVIEDLDPSKLHARDKVKEKDHWVIVQRLADERRMQIKVNKLRERMSELAQTKKSRNGLRKMRGNLVVRTPWIYDNRKFKDPPNWHDKVLYFKEEFNYPRFMKGYYQKHELTEDVEQYKHITFRLVKEAYPDGAPMVVYKDAHALQEKCRNKAFYMIIRSKERQYAKLLDLHETRLRMEIDHLTLALRRRGYSVEEREEFILEFLRSGDVNYKYFLRRTGIEEVPELWEDTDIFERADFRSVKSCYKRTIFEARNPVYTDDDCEDTIFSAISDNSLDSEKTVNVKKIQRALADYWIEFDKLHGQLSSDKDIDAPSEPFPPVENEQQVDEECLNQSFLDVDMVSRLPSRNSPENSYRKASDPSKGISLMENEDSSMSDSFEPSGTSHMAENIPECNDTSCDDNGKPDLNGTHSSTCSETSATPGIVQRFRDACSGKKSRRSTYRKAPDPSKRISLMREYDSSMNSTSDSLGSSHMVEGVQEAIEECNRSLYHDNSRSDWNESNSSTSSEAPTMPKRVQQFLDACAAKKSRGNSYRRASDPYMYSSKKITVVDYVDSSSDSSSTESSPKSSTPGDSSWESEDRRLMVDIEDEDKAEEVRMTDLDDQNLEEIIDVEIEDGAKAVLLPPVETVRKTKCAVCKRRLNITNLYDCRCGNIFCAQHRHAELHQCSFDYRREGRRTIAEQNPRIIGEKIRKI